MKTDINISFRERVQETHGVLKKGAIEILQVNLGKLCNLTCSHCHVEAGPTKTEENMDLETAEAVIRFLDASGANTLDLTGGAPEMNAHFRFLVTEARKRNVKVIDRCNLTVLFLEGQEGLADFLAKNQVEVVASLPCYMKDNVDKQRGRGTFDDSINALQRLNKLGYGKDESSLQLNLVYNPVGAHLPPPQENLERDYKEYLQQHFGVQFNRLFTITNMPITRYQKYLQATNEYIPYMELLRSAFNEETLMGLMCINTLNVNWDGSLYDCDFNNVLDLKVQGHSNRTIHDLAPKDLSDLEIRIADHCFGCTAGAGSSCQGALN